jgi:hypothetical protein
VHFARAQAGGQHRLLKLARIGLLARVLVGMLISYGDIISDVVLAVQYVMRNKLMLGALTVLFPCLTLILHALVALANRDSWLEVVLALMGAKPILDTWKMLSGVKQKTNAALTPVTPNSASLNFSFMAATLPQLRASRNAASGSLLWEESSFSSRSRKVPLLPLLALVALRSQTRSRCDWVHLTYLPPPLAHDCGKQLSINVDNRRAFHNTFKGTEFTPLTKIAHFTRFLIRNAVILHFLMRIADLCNSY